MKKTLIFTIVATSVVTATFTAVAARHHYYAEPEADRHLTKGALQSRVLGEERELIVHLPESYERDPARRYPVLYVLDGSAQAQHTAESAQLMARIGVMPEILIVGLPAGDTRNRDYTPPYLHMDADDPNSELGQANRFLQFLEAELIPHIDQSYRTEPARMLAGYSRGGLFVVYSLLEKPELFHARFAYSPALWRDDDKIVTHLASFLKAGTRAPAFLYLSLGDQENEKMTRAFRNATGVLSASASPQLRWRADFTKGATHQDNAVLSTPVGLYEFYRRPQ